MLHFIAFLVLVQARQVQRWVGTHCNKPGQVYITIWIPLTVFTEIYKDFLPFVQTE